MAKRRIPDLKLLRRLRKAELASLSALLGESAIHAFDKLTLVHAPGEVFGATPRIVGLTRSTLDALPAALDTLDADARARCRVDVPPGDFCPEVADALTSLGFRHSDYRAMMYGNPADTAIPDKAGLEVVPVDSDAVFNEFVQIHHDGWDVPEENRVLPEQLSHWRDVAELFVSRLHGTPLSAGVLHRVDATAYLGPSASTHVLRRQGGHLGLIQRRLARAAESGCNLVFAQAPFDSPAFRNLLKGGLFLAATQAVWTPKA